MREPSTPIQPDSLSGAPFNQSDFRAFLRDELIARCKRNPRFSLRAFANLLGIENSALSKIIHGKRAISPKMIVRLGKQLGLGPGELSRFSALPELAMASQVAQPYQSLTLDEFALISDWYHYAIHEFTRVKGFKSQPAWIANKLEISPAEASSAIDRLLRLNLLERGPKGTLKNKSGALTTTRNEFTAVAFRNFQHQALDRSKKALDQVPMELRDHSTMTMAISKDKIKAAKKKIAQFRRAMSAFLESDTANLDAVYNLHISLYPLTREI